MSARYRSRHWMYRFGPSALGLASPARRCGQRRPGPKDALCGVTGPMGWGDTFTCTVCIAGRSRLTAAPRGSNARVPAGGWWRDFWPCRFQGRSACTAGMRVKLAAGRTLALAVAIASLALAGCGSGGGPAPAGAGGASLPAGSAPGPGMMGGGSGPGAGYHFATLTCTAPPDLPGSTVTVTLADMGMTQMMGGTAPPGAH